MYGCTFLFLYSCCPSCCRPDQLLPLGLDLLREAPGDWIQVNEHLSIQQEFLSRGVETLQCDSVGKSSRWKIIIFGLLHWVISKQQHQQKKSLQKSDRLFWSAIWRRKHFLCVVGIRSFSPRLENASAFCWLICLLSSKMCYKKCI